MYVCLGMIQLSYNRRSTGNVFRGEAEKTQWTDHSEGLIRKCAVLVGRGRH